MVKVPKRIKNQILELLETPKRIYDVSEVIDISNKSTAQYLRAMWKDGEISRITDFKDLRSFFYVKS
jgi:hypothetical protein